MNRPSELAHIARWFALALAFVIAGCSTPETRLVVRIESDMTPASELRTVEVRAQWEGGNALGSPKVLDLRAQGLRLPGEVLLTPRDPSDARRVIVTVTAGVHPDSGADYTLRQEFLTTFQRGQTRSILFYLARVCRQETCPDLLNCVPGAATTGVGVARCVSRENPQVREYGATFNPTAWPDATVAPVDAPDGGIDATVSDLGIDLLTDGDETGPDAGDAGDVRPADADDVGADSPTDGDAADADVVEARDAAPDLAPRCDSPTMSSALPRNCDEIRCRTPDAGSGVYMIDPLGNAARCPDGGVDGGEDAGDGGDGGPVCPFRAYCDMDRDEGGWTLLGAGHWTRYGGPGVLRSEVTRLDENGLLTYDRLRAVIASFPVTARRWLFRLGSNAQRLFIRDDAPDPALIHSTGHTVWASHSRTVHCGISYAQVTDSAPLGTENLASTRGQTCCESPPGFYCIGSESNCGAWSLWYNEAGIVHTLNADGTHPCAFYDRPGSPSGVTSLKDLWVRSGVIAVNGRCEAGCSDPPSCVGGACACVSGQVPCTGGCANTSTDAANCGSCGRTCAAGQTCSGGVCATASSIQRSCDGTPRPPGCGVIEISSVPTFSIGVDDRLADRRTPADPAFAWDASPISVGHDAAPFILDAYEVTVARFRAFWDERVRTGGEDGGTPIPIQYPRGPMIPWAEGMRRFGAREPVQTDVNPRCNWTTTASAREAHPINCVDWWTAQAFCVWDGGRMASSEATGRLPTEKEWEYASRIRVVDRLLEQRTYPWGEDAPRATCDRARWNASECLGEDGARTRRVGSFAPSGGFFDLAGNVSEWVADQFFPVVEVSSGTSRDTCLGSPGTSLCYRGTAPLNNRSIRGGSWRDTDAAMLRSASRNLAHPLDRLSTLGFRCARSVPTGDAGP